MASPDSSASASAQDVVDSGLAMVAVDYEITVPADGNEDVNIDKMKQLSEVACQQEPEKPSYYICNFCRKPFDTQQGVESHLESCKSRGKDKEKTEMYECPECKFLCATLASLASHMKQHEGKLLLMEDILQENNLSKGSYRCNICHKSMSTKGNLAKHQIIHLGVKPYKCNFCDKFFTLKGNRDKHELLHTDNRPHQCQICDKKFSLKGNLQQHILTHSDFKFFQCYLCNKEFTLKGNLDKHIRRHANGMTVPKPISSGNMTRKQYISLKEATQQHSFANTILEIRNIINRKKTVNKVTHTDEEKIDGTRDLVKGVTEVDESEEATMCIPEPDNEIEYDEMAEREEVDNIKNHVEIRVEKVLPKPETVVIEAPEVAVQNL